MTKVAAKKTAGVLGDDLALNAEQVNGVRAERELPVVWAVAKGSMKNKAILVPAALAISAVLPRGANAERDTAFTVIGVTTLSTFAMVLYPMIVQLIGLDHAAAGVFIGATIHDVAQVVGAGFSISEETGTIATFTKLLRVALLLPVVFAFTLVFRNSDGSKQAGAQPPLPWFLMLACATVSRAPWPASCRM